MKSTDGFYSDSDRLSFRQASDNDEEELWSLDQDPRVMRFITGGRLTTREEIRTFALPRIARYTDRQRGWGIQLVRIRGTGEAIGWILVRPMGFFDGTRDDSNPELGWRLKFDAWGCGFGTEAARHVMQSLERTGLYRKFSAMADPENHASINIMKKLGMTPVGRTSVPYPADDLHCVVYERHSDNFSGQKDAAS